MVKTPTDRENIEMKGLRSVGTLYAMLIPTQNVPNGTIKELLILFRYRSVSHHRIRICVTWKKKIRLKMQEKHS